MLILGCGYVGRALGGRLVRDGWTVTGTVTSQVGVPALETLGITPHLLDLDASDTQAAPTGPDEIFYLAPPPGEGVDDPRLGRFLEMIRKRDPAPRIVYISTTGVYGDCRGEWVDESRSTRATTDRARRRLDAEQRLMAWRSSSGGELVVLRVAGIYGPARLPLERLRRGEPMIRGDEAPWTNRVHVDDLVTVCLAAMIRGKDGEIYNVSDGRPGTMAEYFEAVADAAGLPRPTGIGMKEARRVLPARVLSYLSESRRIDNRKMLEGLGVGLEYADFIAGVRASL